VSDDPEIPDRPSFTQGRFSPMAAFRYSEFRIYYAGVLLANIGNWMQQFALGWLVVELAIRDGNPELAAFYLGLVGLARSAPALLSGLVGGVFADRTDRRKLLLVTRTTAMLIAGLLALLTLTGVVNIGLVMVLSAIATATFGFDAPGRMAILPLIVPGDAVFSGMSVTRAAQQSAILIGPLVGGLLVGPYGVGGVLVVIALMYLASAWLVVLMAPRPVSARARATPVLRAFRDGLEYIRGEPVVFWLFVVGMYFAMLAQSFVQLLPAVAHETLHVGAVELSWLAGAAGAGALVGAFLSAISGVVRRRGWMLLGMAAAAGVLLIAFSLQRDLVPAVIFSGLLGCANITYAGSQSNLIQAYCPDHLRGRVMGLMVACFHTTLALGTLIFGTLGAFVGISNALGIAGLMLLLGVAICAWRVAPIRDARDETPGLAPVS
jgi:MFS family permease